MIDRTVTLSALETFREHPVIKQRYKYGHPLKQAQGEGAEIMLQAVKDFIGDAEKLPDEPYAAVRKYAYPEYTDHYRLVPCDNDVRCMACGYKRPLPRGEEVFFCSRCGAVLGGLAEG